MSSSRQNNLQSVEKKSNHRTVIEPPPHSRSIIENTAFWVSKHGSWVEQRIYYNCTYLVDPTRFNFLSVLDPYHAFYKQKIAQYNQDIQPPPEPLRLTCRPKGIKFTLKELDIVHLTAHFVGYYGFHFECDLLKSVSTNPLYESLFQFMNPSDSRYGFFAERIRGFTCWLSQTDANTATALEAFFNILRQVLEKDEEQGARLAFKCFADTDKRRWSEPVSMRMQPPPSLLQSPQILMQPSKLSVKDIQFADGNLDAFRHLDCYDHIVALRRDFNDRLMSLKKEYDLESQFTAPLPEEPEFVDSTLVPEDQFLAQPPGPSTIKVAVTKIIEITVPSLSETVASLKEKIAGEIQVPAKKQKLCGKAGILKDNMSLAHVGAGEVLTLSL